MSYEGQIKAFNKRQSYETGVALVLSVFILALGSAFGHWFISWFSLMLYP